VNADVPFAIATPADLCGNRATQSWTVRVHATPVIESFAAAKTSVAPGESTTLTGVFHGTGWVDSLGAVTSGVPVATPSLNTVTSFTLIVTNGAGARVQQTISIGMLPTVTATNPANGVTGVPVNRVLTATFNNAMDTATITPATFSLRDQSSNPVSGTVTFANGIATFAPASPLANLASYTATISSGVKDLAGNTMVADHSWNFATGAPDTTAPLVTSTFPANGADQVVPESIRLLVSLSEEIDPRSVTSSTFVLRDGNQTSVQGIVRLTAGGNSVEFVPAAALPNSMSYTATVTREITDLGGNRMPADFSWTFMTEASRFGTWRKASTDSAISARARHTAVWTGSEMIIWGGSSDSTGARYNPATDVWHSISTLGAPSPRSDHTAIWTGTEMIIWGGISTGARYDPGTDTWKPVATAGAPIGRSNHTAIWTGTEMIVWGGFHNSNGMQNTGGRYNPITDTWFPTSTTDAPSPRNNPTAVWTGSEMLVWGGQNNSRGARYNPMTDSWQPMAISGAPSAAPGNTAVWTGSEMIVWGGYDGFSWFNTGARYNPLTDAWTPTKSMGNPGRGFHTAVWTGKEMIVWGGSGAQGRLDTGWQFNPAKSTWLPTSLSSAPSARGEHTAVWTGSEMIIWGGDGVINNSSTGTRLATGARFRP
jgi:N-acetylneuraminic acid mutarotase